MESLENAAANTTWRSVRGKLHGVRFVGFDSETAVDCLIVSADYADCLLDRRQALLQQSECKHLAICKYKTPAGEPPNPEEPQMISVISYGGYHARIRMRRFISLLTSNGGPVDLMEAIEELSQHPVGSKDIWICSLNRFQDDIIRFLDKSTSRVSETSSTTAAVSVVGGGGLSVSSSSCSPDVSSTSAVEENCEETKAGGRKKYSLEDICKGTVPGLPSKVRFPCEVGVPMGGNIVGIIL